MNFEMDKKARLTESFNFTESMQGYMLDRLTLLNHWRKEDSPKKDSILDKHYESRIASMVIMVNEAIEYVKSMDHLYDA